ncbi:dynamin family protein [Spartinivicinus poritis]|uniref:Dynamin family protein n=1 Tax=Spartinivicinus poritis TaxID=2994640 RepID=A0ABT5UDX9_9GAMM|nr:dynamin family protein [Spartinivicinus sp. A2-2]MDE1463304.1 dynamin family protein [Spartinivicinus sp. A2-2]
MNTSSLTKQLEQYIDWKRKANSQLSQYTGWLSKNQLSSPEIEDLILRAKQKLVDDAVTLSFVGESSRGKTELINALFSSQFGQKLFPSEVGRTTMCPTEVLSDKTATHAYIRLLPIETRKTERTIASYKASPDEWVTINLPGNNPAEMAKAFNEVSRNRQASYEEARQLGFSPGALEASETTPGKVIIPAWRYAVISFAHPQLNHGLRIIDTPSLNSYGCEPELALDILNHSHAVVFVVSAEKNISINDLAVWKFYLKQIQDDPTVQLLTVLNKVDLLWDDLEGERYAQLTIAQRQKSIAKKLGLAAENILPVSAKHALLGKVRQNQRQISRSNIDALEQALSERVNEHQAKLATTPILQSTLAMMKNSRDSMRLRLEDLKAQHQLIGKGTGENKAIIEELNTQTKAEFQNYHKRLLTLKSNRRLLSRQAELLSTAANTPQFSRLANKLKNSLSGQWTPGAGLAQGIADFFRSLYLDLNNLKLEVSMANKMASSLYERYQPKHDELTLPVPHIDLEFYTQQFRSLQTRSEGFNQQLTAQSPETGPIPTRLFNTLLNQINQTLKLLNEETTHWANDVLQPLLQHTLEQKQLTEQQMVQLRNLTMDAQSILWRSEKISLFINDTAKQLELADGFLGQSNNSSEPEPTMQDEWPSTL